MKTMALNIHGKLTACTSPPDKRGMGRCNHVDHKQDSETMLQFVKRVEPKALELEEAKKKIPATTANGVKLFNRGSIDKIKETEDKEFVIEAQDDMRDYAKYVMTYERDIDIIKVDKAVHGDQWFRDEYQRLDRTRRDKHNNAITSINIVNKLCEEHGFDSFYPGDVKKDHRQDVAESIFEHYKYELSYLQTM